MDQKELISSSEIIQDRTWIEVGSIDDAVQLAEHLSRNDVFDLFRGQLNADWPFTSSLERRNESGRSEAMQQFADFRNFASGNREMKPYRHCEDSLIAIAQHYGIPTSFVDFTTNPRKAAFFCSDSKAPVDPDTMSVIYCLNTRKFQEFWQEMDPMLESIGAEQGIKPSAPEIIRVDVTNLWRLQAQEGCFLWNSISGIENYWWRFDRIVFPYCSDSSVLPKRHEIYPENQSPLEQTLTEFFMNQQMSAGSKQLRKDFKSNFVEINVSDGYYDGVTWSDTPLPSGKDWEGKAHWNPDIVEHVEDSLPGWTIQIEAEELTPAAHDLKSIFTENDISKHREHGITFDFLSHEPNLKKLGRRIQRLWNGMRFLPYTDLEISQCIENTVDLYLATNKKESQLDSGKNWYVEFGKSDSGVGAYSRAHVSALGLSDAFSESFVRIASESFPRSPGDLASLIQLPCRPSQRFSFDGLRTLMVAEIIPSQLVERSGKSVEEELKVWISFSPAELKVFGLC